MEPIGMESCKSISPACTSKNNTPKPDVKKSSWFTPCRQIGLKRKSPSVSTPRPSTESPVNSTPNSSFKSHRRTFETPVKKHDSMEVKRMKNEMGGLSPTTSSVVAIDMSALPSHEDRLVTVSLIEHEGRSTSFKTLNKCMPTKVMPVPRHSVTDVNSTPIRLMPKSDHLELEEPSVEDIEMLRKRIKEKEEQLCVLKSSQAYKMKQDTKKLSTLTKKWLQGCQDALVQLHEKTKSLGYQYTMMELLMQLHIPNVLVQYDPDLDEFK